MAGIEETLQGNAQGHEALRLVDVRDVAQVVVLGRGFGEPPAVVEHARLAELVIQLDLGVIGGVDQERGATEVGVGRGRVFFLEVQADDADVDPELRLDGAVMIQVQSAAEWPP